MNQQDMKKFNEFIKEDNGWTPSTHPDWKEGVEELSSEPSEFYCPHCGIEQGEHPRNVFDAGDGMSGDHECDECGKEFFVDTVYHIVTRK